jgi:hypothetical protein
MVSYRPDLSQVLIAHVTGNSNWRALLLLGEGDHTSYLRVALEYSYSLLMRRAIRRTRTKDGARVRRQVEYRRKKA